MMTNDWLAFDIIHIKKVKFRIAKNGYTVMGYTDAKLSFRIISKYYRSVKIIFQILDKKRI